MIAKKSRRTESALCATLEKTFDKGTVLTPVMPKKTIAPSAASINIDQRAFEDTSVGHNNDSSTYRIHDRTNGKIVSSCEQQCSVGYG